MHQLFPILKAKREANRRRGNFVLPLFFQVQTAHIGNYTNLHHLAGDTFVIPRLKKKSKLNQCINRVTAKAEEAVSSFLVPTWSSYCFAQAKKLLLSLHC